MINESTDMSFTFNGFFLSFFSSHYRMSSTTDLSTYNRVADLQNLHKIRSRSSPRPRPCQHGCTCTHQTFPPAPQPPPPPPIPTVQQTHEPFYQRPEYGETTRTNNNSTSTATAVIVQQHNHQRTDSSNCECRSTPSTTEAKDRYSSSRLNIYDSTKVDEIQSEEDVQGPPLPPRPPLRPRHTFNYRTGPGKLLLFLSLCFIQKVC